MTSHKARHALGHIANAIEEIEEYIAGYDSELCQSDRRTRRAVERAIEIVSEASRKIPEEMKILYPEVPWPEIRAVGIIVRHEYDFVDDGIVWSIATKHLISLKATVAKMIRDLKTDEPDEPKAPRMTDEDPS